jgi:hypothetical protein
MRLLVVLLAGVAVGVLGRGTYGRYMLRREFTAVTEEAARIRLAQAAFRRGLDGL